MTLFTQEKMRALLDALSEGKSMPVATALAYGSRSKIGWVHIRNSRAEKKANLPPEACKYFVRDWPVPDEHHHLCDAADMAQEISRRDFHTEVLQEIRESTRVVIEGGRVQYEVDEKLVAEWPDAQSAFEFGGIEDWPFKHDENGARIPLRVRDRTSAALTLKALAAVNPEVWDRPQQISVDKRITKAVLVLGEKKAQPQDSPLRMDLKQRLEQIRANPTRPSAKPSAPVDLGNGGRSAGDPQEQISNSMGDDVKPDLRNQPRAYEVPRLSPPRRDPQEPVSYAKPDHRLDAQDRKGEPPPGGFKVR